MASGKTASTSKPADAKGGSDAGSAPLNSVISTPTPSWPLQHPNYDLKAQYRPWDFTRKLISKSHPRRRMRFLVQALEEEQIRSAQQQREFPDFKAGDVLEIRMMAPENGRKEYIYKGVCIARYNKGIRTSFKLYNVFPETGGFVQHLPLYMPDLLSIKVVGQVKARRAKLYHLLEDQTNKQQYQSNVAIAK